MGNNDENKIVPYSINTSDVGMKATVKIDEVYETDNTYGDGDIDDDKDVDLDDAEMVEKFVKGSLELDQKQKRRADVNKDGIITMCDKWLIVRSYYHNVALPVNTFRTNETRAELRGEHGVLKVMPMTLTELAGLFVSNGIKLRVKYETKELNLEDNIEVPSGCQVVVQFSDEKGVDLQNCNEVYTIIVEEGDDPITSEVFGDLDDDSDLDEDDIDIIDTWIEKKNLTKEEIAKADANGDGIITEVDKELMEYEKDGLISNLPYATFGSESALNVEKLWAHEMVILRGLSSKGMTVRQLVGCFREELQANDIKIYKYDIDDKGSTIITNMTEGDPDAKVGTGCRVFVSYSGFSDNAKNLRLPLNVVLYGDINGDGVINLSDALAIVMHVNERKLIDGHAKEEAARRLNDDTKINLLDALVIVKYYINLDKDSELSSWPIELNGD